MTPNRRAFDRGQVHGAYAAFPGGAAGIRNFSIGGLMLDDDEPLLVGSPMNLELHFGEEILYCEGVVRRCEPGSGMAVEFQHLPLPTRETLARLVGRATLAATRKKLADKLDASFHEYRLRSASAPSGRPAPMERQNLGEILIRLGILNEEQLASALAYQRRVGGSLVTALVSAEIVGEETLVRCFEREFRLPVVDVWALRPTRDALRLVSHEMVVRHAILPVGLADSTLTLAIADPTNHDGLQQVKFSSGCDLRITLAPARSLLTMIDRVYAARSRLAS